jgi:putative holliday junction resolvase
MTFRRGVRLGIDVGAVRIGLAVCDPDGILATPVGVVARGDGDLAAIAAAVDEHGAMEVLVGFPVSLNGDVGTAAVQVMEFARQLSRCVNVPIRMVDERLTTASAQRSLHRAGRNTRESKSMIDAAAAALIVQNAIDFEKSTARPAGDALSAE